jgi:hypothetical protein
MLATNKTTTLVFFIFMPVLVLIGTVASERGCVNRSGLLHND